MVHGTAYGTVASFDVLFNELSDLNRCESSLPWTFAITNQSGTCLNADWEYKNTDPVGIGEQYEVGALFVRTSADDTCTVEINASLSYPGVTVPDSIGTYTLTDSGVAPICPTCSVPEIPSIIHPLGIYPGDSASAQSAYTGAQTAVSSLVDACSGGCPQAAEDKLEQAQIHLNTAALYLGICSGSGPSCRLANYYAIRASDLVAEGLSLV
jgi:hypothetical protein